ncbi:MAG: hypothetical protein ABSG51_11275 [Terracidiphilus sp.]|jgi:hypothetical protein
MNDRKLDRLQFLYDKRFSALNTRRDHEWKNYFGTIGLVGAIDAAYLQFQLHLTPMEQWAWIGVLILVFGFSFWYHSELQKRNIFDRDALNAIYNEICHMLGPQLPSAILERDFAKEARNNGHLVAKIWNGFKRRWAFWPQIGLLLVVIAVSVFLPFSKFGTAKKVDQTSCDLSQPLGAENAGRSKSVQPVATEPQSLTESVSPKAAKRVE